MRSPPATLLRAFRDSFAALAGVAVSKPGAWWETFRTSHLKETGARALQAAEIRNVWDQIEKAGKGALPGGAYIVLERIPKEPLHPVLFVEVDIGRVYPRQAYRVALVKEDGTAVRGFRFESPGGDGGMHDYYHVQSIDPGELRGKGAQGPTEPGATQPAFPLRVDPSRPWLLLAAMVCSIYSCAEGGPLFKAINGNPSWGSWRKEIDGPRHTWWNHQPSGKSARFIQSWEIDGAGGTVRGEHIRERQGHKGASVTSILFDQAQPLEEDRYPSATPSR